MPNNLFLKLFKLHDLLSSRYMQRELADESYLQVTLAQADVMRMLFLRAPQGAMLKEIAAHVNLTPGAASVLVDSLVRQQVLTRRPSESDRRAVCIGLAPRGEECRRRFMAFLSEEEQHITDALPAEEFAALLQSTDRINEIIGNDSTRK